MSNFVLALIVFALLFIWFCWLILRADRPSASAKSSIFLRMSLPVVKFPATRVPSRIPPKKLVDSIVKIRSSKPSFNSKSSPSQTSPGQTIPTEFERYLLRSCAGNRDTVEGLIQFEIKRSMGLSTRAEAAHAAYDRLLRDRTR